MSETIGERVLQRMKEIISLLLWDAAAIKVSLDEPFKLVSGNYSPIYINCRRVISDPAFMRMFTSVAKILCKQREVEVEVVAGGETAGIPFAAYTADNWWLPMVYVRKAKKQHGMASLVEGSLPGGARVLLVEDLITDGKSKLGFIDSLQAAGAIVEHVLVLFDRLQGGREALRQRGIQLHAVTDMDSSLAVGEAEELVPAAHVDAVRDYIKSPRDWHAKRGIPFNE